jgi:hypothetical protein
MPRIAAIIQLIVIVAIVAFATYQMFLGNLTASFATLPLLLVYYIFVTLRRNRK